MLSAHLRSIQKALSKARLVIGASTRELCNGKLNNGLTMKSEHKGGGNGTLQQGEQPL